MLRVMNIFAHQQVQNTFSRFLFNPGVKVIRCFSSSPPRKIKNSKNEDKYGKERLVILGTGWGSYSVLKNIKKNKSLLKHLSVIVISPRNHFLFTPLLASTTVGTLEFRSIIEPVRNTGFRDEHDFHLSDGVGLDMQNKVVHCRSALAPDIEYDVPYDKLVIGVGAVANDFGIPGVKEHAYYLRVICRNDRFSLKLSV